MNRRRWAWSSGARWALVVWLCAGCGDPLLGADRSDSAATSAEDSAALGGLAQVLAAAYDAGASVQVGPVVVASPPARLGGTVYVQELSTGLAVPIEPADSRLTWPPEVGTEVMLDAVWLPTEAAPTPLAAGGSLWLSSGTSWEAVGTAPPVVRDLADDPAQAVDVGALVRLTDLTVAHPSDGVGDVWTAGGLRLRRSFVAELPLPSSGTELTGLVVAPGVVAPRGLEADLVLGEPVLAPILATIADLRAGKVPFYSWVQIIGTLATPWSADGQALVQSAGQGVWVHEGLFDVAALSASTPDKAVTVTTPGAFLRLSAMWLPGERLELIQNPVASQTLSSFEETPWFEGDPLPPASLVRAIVREPGPVQPDGSRATALGWALDARFGSVAGLTDGTLVVGAVDARDELVRFAPIEVLATPVAGP